MVWRLQINLFLLRRLCFIAIRTIIAKKRTNTLRDIGEKILLIMRKKKNTKEKERERVNSLGL